MHHLVTVANRSLHQFSIKQFFSNSLVPFTFLKITEDLRELLFIWVVPIYICNNKN